MNKHVIFVHVNSSTPSEHHGFAVCSRTQLRYRQKQDLFPQTIHGIVTYMILDHVHGVCHVSISLFQIHGWSGLGAWLSMLFSFPPQEAVQLTRRGDEETTRGRESSNHALWTPRNRRDARDEAMISGQTVPFVRVNTLHHVRVATLMMSISNYLA